MPVSRREINYVLWASVSSCVNPTAWVKIEGSAVLQGEIGKKHKNQNQSRNWLQNTLVDILGIVLSAYDVFPVVCQDNIIFLVLVAVQCYLFRVAFPEPFL